MPSLRHQAVVTYMRITRRKDVMRTADSLHASIARRRRTESPNPPLTTRRHLEIARRKDVGFPIYNVTPLGVDDGRRVVYLHGGTYIHTISRQHWRFVGKIAKNLRATVTVPDFPIAPKHTWRESIPKLVDVVRDTAAGAAAGCYLVGDSSGGGLALAVAQRLAQHGALPSPLVLIAPFLDVTVANPASRGLESVDPWLSVEGLREAGRLWAGRDDPRRPEVSPLFGKLDGLGPMLVLTGTRDLLNPQAHDLADEGRKQNASVELVEEPGLIHDYPLLPIPEARRALDQILEFMSG